MARWSNEYLYGVLGCTGLESPPLPGGEYAVKVSIIRKRRITLSMKLTGELLEGNLTSSSYGEGLETCRARRRYRASPYRQYLIDVDLPPKSNMSISEAY